MIRIKTPEDIEKLKESGAILAQVVRETGKMIKVGVSTDELEDFACNLIKKLGATPAFLGYTPEGANRKYPASMCISINEEIVHGIPNEDPKILKDGDIVTIDGGVKYEGMITDHAHTYAVGDIDEQTRKLLNATEEALYAGIEKAKAGNTTGDIGHAIEEVANRNNLAIFRELVGHGVGYDVHEEPYFTNYGESGTGDELKEGMVIAIEPMFGLGENGITLEPDGYTYSTSDGTKSAHFEHTVAISKEGPIILTK